MDKLLSSWMLYDTITELKRDRGRKRKHSTGTLQMACDRWRQSSQGDDLGVAHSLP